MLGGEDFAGWKGVALVAGEETRSREAGEYAKVPTRHLVLLRAAERVCDAMRTGCGDDG
ncbi:MAG: hypothetical protein ACRD3K_07900 [Edaphobacter sp.]